MRIEGICTTLPETKRCHLPGIIGSHICPECDSDIEVDLGNDYLPDGKHKIYFNCECGYTRIAGITVEIKITLTGEYTE